MTTRRGLLAVCVALVATGCARVAPRAPVPTPTAPAEFGPWRREAREILSDALETLRAFEDFAAFRVSTAAATARRAATDLSWDPPGSGLWAEALHVSEGLAGRADQLFLRVLNAQLDRSLWREQREMADQANELVTLGEALNAYRGTLERLPPRSDGTDAWAALDRLWASWTACAGQWNVSRTESISCYT